MKEKLESKIKNIKITPADVAIIISLLSIAITTIDFILKKL